MSRNRKRALEDIALLLTIAVIAYFTLFTRQLLPNRKHIFRPFYSYFELVVHGNYGWAIQNFLNILLFVPFGAMFYLKMRSRALLNRKRVLITGFIGFVLSFVIENIQYWFKLGFFETDDLFNNTVGTLLGSLFVAWGISVRVKYKHNEKSK